MIASCDCVLVYVCPCSQFEEKFGALLIKRNLLKTEFKNTVSYNVSIFFSQIFPTSDYPSHIVFSVV